LGNLINGRSYTVLKELFKRLDIKRVLKHLEDGGEWIFDFVGDMEYHFILLFKFFFESGNNLKVADIFKLYEYRGLFIVVDGYK
jgi:hypothetical protein